MSTEVIDFDNAGHIYSAWMNFLVGNPSRGEVPSRLGMTTEVQGVTVLQRPLHAISYPYGRRFNYFGMLAESFWLLSDIEDVETMSVWNDSLKHYSDDGNILYGAYGKRLNRFASIEKAIQLLRQDHNTRQVVIDIFENRDLGAISKDIPCNTQIMFKIRNEKLNLSVMNRSNDIHLGLMGVNIPQFSLLLQYVAARVGVDLGTQTHFSDSLHLYIELAQHEIITSRMRQHGGIMFAKCLSSNLLIKKERNERGNFSPDQADEFDATRFLRRCATQDGRDITSIYKESVGIFNEQTNNFLAFSFFALSLYSYYKQEMDKNDVSRVRVVEALIDMAVYLDDFDFPYEWFFGCCYSMINRIDDIEIKKDTATKVMDFLVINTDLEDSPLEELHYFLLEG